MPRAEPKHRRKRTPIDAAIERARDGLFERQRDDGAWNAPADTGAYWMAFQLVVEKWLGVLSARDAAEGKRGLLFEQQRDGSFLPWPTAPNGTLCATAMAYAGLIALDAGEEPRARKARAFIGRNGGFDAVIDAFRAEGDLAAVGLLLAGLVDADFLPKVGLEVAVLPFERIMESRVHGGNMMAMMALMALRARFAPRRRRVGLLGGFARGVERARVETFMAEFQAPDGSWNGTTFFTLLPVVALHAVGMAPHEEPLRRALTWLDGMKRYTPDGLRIVAFHSDVWTTSFASLALLASGVDRDHPRLRAAQDHLLAQQIRRPQHRQLQRQRGVPRIGGWPFQSGNEVLPDVDDTGLVLAVLGAMAGDRAERDLFAALELGAGWTCAMQNPDGGFPSYVWGHSRRSTGPLFLDDLAINYDEPKAILAFVLDPPEEYGDPSLEGVTARALWGLAACGVRRNDPVAVRAIEFLRRHQCETGAWWGRWMAAYVVETACILMALQRVGEDMNAGYVRRAVSWILSIQNADGGWGDTTAAYRDPSQAGIGPSSAPITAFALLGLMAAVGAHHESVVRGIDWLVREQRRSDGLWDLGSFIHCVVPPNQFYRLDAHESTPLWALGEYRRRPPTSPF